MSGREGKKNEKRKERTKTVGGVRDMKGKDGNFREAKEGDENCV